MVAGEGSGVQRLLLIYGGLALLAAWVLVPFAWMVMSSIKTTEEVTRVPIVYLPEHPTLDNYAILLAVSSSHASS